MFKAITNWLKDRKRLFPDEAPKEGAQVTEMRNLLRDPEIVRELKKMLGTAPPPAERRGRPPGAVAVAPRDPEAEQRKSAEGSALHALVFDGEGIEDQR